ncbi:MAG: M16 family metallopeptidase [Candidatus Babeliales bacterium]
MKLLQSVKYLATLLILTTHVQGMNYNSNQQNDMKYENNLHADNDTSNNLSHVFKDTLDNGMTVLVRPVHSIPHVAIQLWYNVGSKDEKTGEKGIAHLIEHMIFKGTAGKKSLNLAESDINIITHMLSGSCNAFTFYDYTGYEFNFPVHNWKYALPIMADCMKHAAFKEDHLSSEMKAVIQELKMRKDNYTLSLVESLITAIFTDHPYHYPIIGYKQDLWSVHSDDLHAFYKKHYVPNNATLVVVGDVDPEEVFALAHKSFGHIPEDTSYTRPTFLLHKDIIAKSVTLYRDVQQPVVVLGYVIPGSQDNKDYLIDIVARIVGDGKGSRLYKLLVDELQLVTSLFTGTWNLFEHSLLFIGFEPKKLDDADVIIKIIQKELDVLIAEGPTDTEIMRAVKTTRMGYFRLLESSHDQAYEIGKYFLATGDENYIDIYLQEPPATIKTDIQQFLKNYVRPAVTHKGMVLPLPESEQDAWKKLQHESDELDTKILSARVRTTPLEAPHYAHKIKPHAAGTFNFPKAQTATLSNGMKVMYYDNDNTKKIDVIIELKAKGYDDPQDKQGLYNFVTSLMTEGTKHYSATELAQEFESRGMSFSVTPGAISLSMLSCDLTKGLELLREIVERATFNPAEIEKIRTQLLTDLANFWDNPKSFSGQLIRETIYKGHPYSKNELGTKESIHAITRDQLIEGYKKYITPSGVKIAIVGDLAGCDIIQVLEQTVGSWKGAPAVATNFPPVLPAHAATVNYPINRDQVTLCFAAPSVDRKDSLYDRLLIFDQILGGGMLGSMNSRLFKLREQTGLFYTINGSLIAQAGEQPGMVLVKTLVSTDRLKEAEDAIKHTLRMAAATITEQEFEEAKNAIINAAMLNFESNMGIAQVFLFLDKYGLSATYFDNRAQSLAAITITDVQDAVKKVLKVDDLVTLTIGRVPAEEKA